MFQSDAEEAIAESGVFTGLLLVEMLEVLVGTLNLHFGDAWKLKGGAACSLHMLSFPRTTVEVARLHADLSLAIRDFDVTLQHRNCEQHAALVKRMRDVLRDLRVQIQWLSRTRGKTNIDRFRMHLAAKLICFSKIVGKGVCEVVDPHVCPAAVYPLRLRAYFAFRWVLRQVWYRLRRSLSVRRSTTLVRPVQVIATVNPCVPERSHGNFFVLGRLKVPLFTRVHTARFRAPFVDISARILHDDNLHPVHGTDIPIPLVVEKVRLGSLQVPVESMADLRADINRMLFVDRNKRPWQGERHPEKTMRRLQRLFFLAIEESGRCLEHLKLLRDMSRSFRNLSWSVRWAETDALLNNALCQCFFRDDSQYLGTFLGHLRVAICIACDEIHFYDGIQLDAFIDFCEAVSVACERPVDVYARELLEDVADEICTCPASIAD